MVHRPLGPKNHSSVGDGGYNLCVPVLALSETRAGRSAVAAEQLGLAHQPASFNLQFNVFFFPDLPWLAASWRTKTKSWRRPTIVLNIKHCLHSVGKAVSDGCLLLKRNLLTRAES